MLCVISMVDLGFMSTLGVHLRSRPKSPIRLLDSVSFFLLD